MWRTAFGLGIIPLAFIIYWRTFRLCESAVWAAAQSNRNRNRETALLFRHFWHRYAAPDLVRPSGGFRTCALQDDLPYLAYPGICSDAPNMHALLRTGSLASLAAVYCCRLLATCGCWFLWVRLCQST